MQAMPVPERQLESLQRLLGELCARGDIATLVQLPLSGRLLTASQAISQAPGVPNHKVHAVQCSAQGSVAL